MTSVPAVAPASTADLSYAGLTRHVEVGVVVAPTHATAVAAAKSLAAFLDDTPAVPVRLAGVDVTGSRLLLTIAVGLGTVEEVKVADAPARAAVVLLQRVIDEFSAYDPAFVLLPDPASDAAQLAAHLVSAPYGAVLPEAVHRLARIG